MKISAYHKENGHSVSLLLSYDNIRNYDKVYISKVFARWCNQPAFFKKKSFREYAVFAAGSAEHYMMDFERQHPEIAAEYFDMKWSDFIESGNSSSK